MRPIIVRLSKLANRSDRMCPQFSLAVHPANLPELLSQPEMVVMPMRGDYQSGPGSMDIAVLCQLAITVDATVPQEDKP